MDIHCFVTTENRICIHLITLKVAYFAGYSVDAGGCGFRGIRHRLDNVFRDLKPSKSWEIQKENQLKVQY